jgi:hypothetical protein
MKYVAKVLVAGMMALLLAACGQEAPKQPEVKQDAPASAEAAPAAPAAEGAETN